MGGIQLETKFVVFQRATETFLYDSGINNWYNFC